MQQVTFAQTNKCIIKGLLCLLMCSEALAQFITYCLTSRITDIFYVCGMYELCECEMHVITMC